jgi:hypothetical protein
MSWKTIKHYAFGTLELNVGDGYYFAKKGQKIEDWKRLCDTDKSPAEAEKLIPMREDLLKEFAINLPMTGVGSIATDQSTYDVTAAIQVPQEVDTAKFDHISVYVDQASVTNFDPKDPCVCVDVVLSVCVANPESGTSSTYKMVKRLSFDKVKLACQAEHLTPVQVVEAEESEEDQLVVEQEMAAFYARRRIQEMAGIFESNGKKKFKILFKYDDPSGNGVASSEVTYDAIVDKAHARHVFGAKINKDKFKNAKIVRVTEVE